MQENHHRRDLACRRNIIKDCNRVVVKVGTRLLTDSNRISVLIDQLAVLRERGYKILLVSSGAVGIGMKMMDVGKRPTKLSEVQALASVGQARLMSMYESAAVKNGFHVAQLLLTATGLKERERHLNVLNCIHALWNQGVLPIINENDAVSVDELKFGDNDILAALLASMTRAELTVLLTTVDGLHQVDEHGALGERISVVGEISDQLVSYASGTDDSSLSIGGMISKLRAAEIVSAAGDCLWIADGRDSDVIEKIFSARDVGTLFLSANKKPMQSRKRWIKFFSKKAGTIVVDAGAVKAIMEKGRSLLPSGVIRVDGDFKRGDTIAISDTDGRVIAKGLSNYSSAEVNRIAGQHSRDIAALLGYAADEVVVHRNNLAVIRSSGKVFAM